MKAGGRRALFTRYGAEVSTCSALPGKPRTKGRHCLARALQRLASVLTLVPRELLVTLPHPSMPSGLSIPSSVSPTQAPSASHPDPWETIPLVSQLSFPARCTFSGGSDQINPSWSARSPAEPTAPYKWTFPGGRPGTPVTCHPHTF